MTLHTSAAALAVAGLAFATVALMPGEAAAQCAMCRTVLASPEGQQLIAALRGGILLLLAAPFTIFGTIAVLAVRMQRNRVAQAADRSSDVGGSAVTAPSSGRRSPL